MRPTRQTTARLTTRVVRFIAATVAPSLLLAAPVAPATADSLSGTAIQMLQDKPMPATGHDVSNYTGRVDWTGARHDGAHFVYIYASEATKYRNKHFAQQYNGSYDAGIIRGAYHFAEPDRSSGAKQAQYFLSHGGGWSNDGRTLPGALDLEPLPNRQSCYGLSPGEMRTWITDFSDTYRAATSRDPVIYTSTSWWNTCTDHWTDAAKRHPLWLASWATTPGPLPAGWDYYTFWQTADRGDLPGDQDVFNGSLTQLHRFATGE
ncbi:MAG: lysozyme [Actinomycetales bacterium]